MITICDVAPVAAWLMDGARSARAAPDAVTELCERLVASGIPLYRVAVFVRALHPQLMGTRFIWKSGEPLSVMQAPHDISDSTEFKTSPVHRVISTCTAIRRRIADPDCPDDFTALSDLRAEGVTDYLVTPLVFTDGDIHVLTWTTREPGGFTDAQIAGIESLQAPLARVTEIRVLRRNAHNLLETYLGKHAGERVLAGKIRRGDTEAIRAAIWLSDMRGFTALADRLPPEKLIGLLNRYFDCQVPAIVDRGGEVLKFMGDGLLAIFPVATDGRSDIERVCGKALAAAQKARAKVASLAERADIEGVDAVRFGVGLHLGEVLFGNIGSWTRLDFTCIGPAVNLVARIEKLASKLHRTTLASAEFALNCGSDLTPVGEFKLPGFDVPHRVFGLADEGKETTD